MNPTDYFSVKLKDQKLIFLDQTKLPLEEVYVESDNLERIAEAIECLEVRGAPLIGIVAAYALALSLKNVNDEYEKVFNLSYGRLAQTRPTAVNLFKALD
ncbi:MAG TPA: S-methyl-5-thioribose-1-phosphate isomerase, partial [Ignavibacteriaceae bacterium]